MSTGGDLDRCGLSVRPGKMRYVKRLGSMGRVCVYRAESTWIGVVCLNGAERLGLSVRPGKMRIVNDMDRCGLSYVYLRAFLLDRGRFLVAFFDAFLVVFTTF